VNDDCVEPRQDCEASSAESSESLSDWASPIEEFLREYPKLMRSAVEEYRRSDVGRELAKFFMRPTSLDGQKITAAKRHQNLAKRDDWLRAEFAKKCVDDPNYSVEQFRNWLKRSRKFAKQLRPNGKLISVQRLRDIVDQVDPQTNL
jgi:hypothetical protein